MTLLVLGATLRLVSDWERTPVRVPATMSQCETTLDSEGDSSYDCVFSWTFHGVRYTQDRSTNGVYADGTRTGVFVDPRTGGASDHQTGMIAFGAGAAALCVLGTVGYAVGLARTRSSAWRLRRWLRDQAWWRQPAPARTSGTTASAQPTVPVPAPAAPDFDDAVAAASVVEPADAVSDLIEDARPPGY